VIDLGPEGGGGGGEIVAEGTPEQVARVKASHTGKALAPVLAAAKARDKSRDSSQHKSHDKSPRGIPGRTADHSRSADRHCCRCFASVPAMKTYRTSRATSRPVSS
jgi:excinuclease ABC subunit A